MKIYLQNNVFCIVKIDNCRGYDYFNAIYNKGYVESRYVSWVETFGNFIAEYPTWQEAVNSPEFKGDK